MSKPKTENDVNRTNYGTTMIQLARRGDGTWEATQHGLNIVGTGSSAARATEDLAGQIAVQLEDDSS